MWNLFSTIINFFCKKKKVKKLNLNKYISNHPQYNINKWCK